jgi:hypothetical protein
MSTVSSYFEHIVDTECGIPSFHIQGKRSDWERIISKLDDIEDLLLPKFAEAWLIPLRDTLSRFVIAFDNTPDQSKFWNSFFDYESESGGSMISGWINTLFPYVYEHKGKKWIVNAAMQQTWKQREKKSTYTSTSKFVTTSAFTDFKWEYVGNTIPMKMYAGIAGVSQDTKSLLVSPKMGWCVAYDSSVKLFN